MTLYHSTFRRFDAFVCTMTPMVQPYNWPPSSQLQHAKLCSCRCFTYRHTLRSGDCGAVFYQTAAKGFCTDKCCKAKRQKPIIKAAVMSWLLSIVDILFFKLFNISFVQIKSLRVLICFNQFNAWTYQIRINLVKDLH